MKDAATLKHELAQCTGSCNKYRWSPLFRNFLLTEGVKHLCDNGGEHGCYWVVDAIASYWPELRKNPDTRLHEMQFWTLKVKPDRTAVLTCVADTGERPTVTQKWDSTDLQLDEIVIWAEWDGQYWTLLLPSEH